jgi:MFS family permease
MLPRQLSPLHRPVTEKAGIGRSGGWCDESGCWTGFPGPGRVSPRRLFSFRRSVARVIGFAAFAKKPLVAKAGHVVGFLSAASEQRNPLTIGAVKQIAPLGNAMWSDSHPARPSRACPATGGKGIYTDVPARLDRLPLSRFHLLVVTALGVTWILDGLEVTIVGAIGPMLQDPQTLGLSATQVGNAPSSYVIGAVIGALLFGWLTDRFGRRFVFYTTLVVYLAGVLLTAVSWSFASFAVFRAVTGVGIGGEYAAINSAIDELIPARYRGRIDLIVNGSFWLGAAVGSGGSLLFLDPALVPPNLGWRLGFAIGGLLGISILLMRRYVPESPRWLVTHGYAREAEATVTDIEQGVAQRAGSLEPPAGGLEIHPRKSFGFGLILRAMFGRYRGRSVLALTLMIAQSFLFNAVFFSYGLVLNRFHDVPEGRAGIYLAPLAVSNFLGPLLLGSLFDTVGRRTMICATFALAGMLLIATALAFGFDAFSAWTQTLAWMSIFFFASAAASSAYLTASEIFPLETRALAIAVFYALGTAIGGAVAPSLFGYLIGTGSQWALAGGYLFAAALMLIAALVEASLGVDAEGRPLETIAGPLSAS